MGACMSGCSKNKTGEESLNSSQEFDSGFDGIKNTEIWMHTTPF